ncbi:hypothetical protein [uncultured Treponema sp.]|uniref:hypothetical protein n=1 Tax=uncultured Treponema sp. TaxID=162155 RepID=UPI0025EFCB8F|nr:hypothetical protein [uncultured Treponema sp.]
MKKITGAVLVSALFSAALFAYNPPAGSQNVLRLTEPQLITGANSVAGGGVFGATPASIINNPALTAWEQRITLDVAGTLFINSNTDAPYDYCNSLGEAFQGGILFPSRWCVSTLLFQGVWTKAFDMPIGDNISFTAGVAKDITDQVSVGLSGNFGLIYGDLTKSDWSASAALGAYYNFGDLSFLQNLRFGFALTNIGKMYDRKEAMGIKTAKKYRDYVDSGDTTSPFEADDATMWPGICTPRFGVAASLLKNESMDLGLSLDFAAPGFQDFAFDAGVNLQLWDFLKINSAWEFDLQEFSNDAKNLLPSVGVSFKFLFKSSNGSYLERKGWAESDMTVSGAWKQLYKNVNAVSAGAVMNLGLADTKAPEIILWGEE